MGDYGSFEDDEDSASIPAIVLEAQEAEKAAAAATQNPTIDVSPLEAQLSMEDNRQSGDAGGLQIPGRVNRPSVHWHEEGNLEGQSLQVPARGHRPSVHWLEEVTSKRQVMREIAPSVKAIGVINADGYFIATLDDQIENIRKPGMWQACCLAPKR